MVTWTAKNLAFDYTGVVDEHLRIVCRIRQCKDDTRRLINDLFASGNFIVREEQDELRAPPRTAVLRMDRLTYPLVMPSGVSMTLGASTSLTFVSAKMKASVNARRDAPFRSRSGLSVLSFGP